MIKSLDGPVLVTGGTGFIGSHLVRRLVRSSADVHIIHRHGGSMERIADMHGAVTIWNGDLTDAERTERIFRDVQPTFVVHLAATTDARFLDARFSGVRESVRSDVLGSLNVLIAAALTPSMRRLVRAGGIEEYGRGIAPFREEQREAPVSPYSASQVAVTHFYQMLQQAVSFDVVTLRLALVYGPMQSERFLIPSLIRHCLESRNFAMSAGTQLRDLIYVEDVVDALLDACVADRVAGEVINISSGLGRQVAEIAGLVVSLCGSPIQLKFGVNQPRMSEVATLICDPTRAREMLGWEARTTLERGLAGTISWSRETAGAAAQHAAILHKDQ